MTSTMSPIKTPMKSALKGSVAPQSENETAAKADVSFLSPPKSVLKTTNARRLRNLMSVIDGHDDDSFSLDDSTRLNIAAKNGPGTDTSRQGKEGNDLYGFSKRGSQAASCSRWLFLITMLLAAAGLATTAYLTLEKDQDESFDREVRTKNLCAALWMYCLKQQFFTFLSHRSSNQLRRTSSHPRSSKYKKSLS